MHKKKILILCYSNLERDPRVIRQIMALQDNYSVITAGLARPRQFEVPFVMLNQESKKPPKYWNYHWLVRKFFSAAVRLISFLAKRIAKKQYYESSYWSKSLRGDFKKLLQFPVDLIIANDLSALPLCVKLSKFHNSKLVFDAHEYYPLEFENKPEWMKFQQKYNTYLCDKYIPHADLLTCVGSYILKEYEKQFKVNKSLVVYNAANYVSNLYPTKVNNKISLVYHGIVNSSLGIEILLDIMNYLPNQYELNLLLVKSDYESEYYESVVRKARRMKNIILHTPKPFTEIIEFINQFDVFLCLIPPTNFNYKYSLPNKFFEGIQARLCIISGPSIEMKEIIEKYGIGITSKTFDPKEIAETILSLSVNQIDSFKFNAAKYAEELSAKKSAEMLREYIMEIL